MSQNITKITVQAKIFTNMTPANDNQVLINNVLKPVVVNVWRTKFFEQIAVDENITDFEEYSDKCVGVGNHTHFVKILN